MTRPRGYLGLVIVVITTAIGFAVVPAPPAAAATVTITTSAAIAGELGQIRVNLAGARIKSISLKLDGWFVGEPIAVSGRTAVGTVTWPESGRHEISAIVTLVNGRRVVRRTTIVVSPFVRDRLQLVYLYPTGTSPVPGRAEAMAATARGVQTWFAGQMAGRSPRFVLDAAGDPVVSVVQAGRSAAAFASDDDMAEDLIPTWRSNGTIASEAFPVVFIEGRQGGDGACGWTTGGTNRHITIPMANCEIYPTGDPFPYGAGYLLAHEITHALGAVDSQAPHEDGSSHVDDDPRDILYNGRLDRDWLNLMLDPGHDDYYLTGRPNLANVERSPLLQG